MSYNRIIVQEEDANGKLIQTMSFLELPPRILENWKYILRASLSHWMSDYKVEGKIFKNEQ